ncbi:MAG TPA: ornithine carbamoyltransferase [Gemmatimonadaceae bacterium]|nr:ornithine carbamoyltransferase [Gemmatimonadaceae bacterium]
MRPHRDFLTIPEFSRAELDALFALAQRMKDGRYRKKPLAGRSLAMIFAKASTRTRVSFEVGAWQLGAQALFLSSRDLQLGRGEPIADTARVLSRMVHGIMIRTFQQSEVEELAAHADVPVINGLTDLHHPCQVLADLLTVRQAFGSYEGKKVAWVGDGNNVANSWLDAARVLGFELALACPEGYDPDWACFEQAKRHASVTLVRDPREAVAGAHVVNTDVWASMGQEEERAARAKAFAGYTVDAALMKRARRDAIFLHCLPAHRGEEVAAAVIDGPQSRVWDEAENRLHVQKAILAVLMGGERLRAKGEGRMVKSERRMAKSEGRMAKSEGRIAKSEESKPKRKNKSRK